MCAYVQICLYSVLFIVIAVQLYVNVSLFILLLLIFQDGIIHIDRRHFTFIIMSLLVLIRVCFRQLFIANLVS